MVTQQQVEAHRLGELGRPAEAAPGGVVLGYQRVSGGDEVVGGGKGVATGEARRVEVFGHP